MSVRKQLRRLGLGPLLLKYVITPVQSISTLRYPDHDVKIKSRDNMLVVFSPRRNRIGRALYDSGVWEPAVTNALEVNTGAGMTALDVGADIGYYALQLSRLVGDTGRVLAFEPIPQARERLEYNIALNNRSNICVSAFALGNQEGTVYLEDPFLKSRVNLSKSSAAAGDIPVTIRRLDDLLEELQLESVDIIKMDIEGAEHEALKGMEQILLKSQPLVILEVHNHFLKLFESSSAELLEWLAHRGYKFTELESDGPENELTTTYLCEPVSGRKPSLTAKELVH